MDSDPFYRMTPLEVATGWVVGLDSPLAKPATIPSDPLDALRAILLPALGREPCAVAFSGGRDSSAVLALAVEVARREGLPLPIPVTNVFPDVPETDETEWQELVIRHLGLTEWERLSYHDDADLIGPSAVHSLRQHGLLWPPTVHLNSRIWAVARGGSLVTGEGGDEVFGFRRITPLVGLLHRQVHPRRRALRIGVEGLLSGRLRKRIIESTLREANDRPWLQPAAQTDFTRAMVDEMVSEPLRWDHGTLALLQRRAVNTALHNMSVAAGFHDVTYVHPFLDPRFVHSWAALGGRTGFAGRTAATQALFQGLLPEAVLSRKSKVYFEKAYLGRITAQFALEWDGEGIDADLVDASVLRDAWTAKNAATLPLLHTAWLSVDQRYGLATKNP